MRTFASSVRDQFWYRVWYPLGKLNPVHRKQRKAFNELLENRWRELGIKKDSK